MKATLKRFAIIVVGALCAAALVPALAFADTDSGPNNLVYEPGVSDDVTQLTVTKQDSESRVYVEGATLAIIKKDTGEEMVRWVTKDEPVTYKRWLNQDKPLNIDTQYILREVEAPEGYSKADDTVFTIDAQGTLKIISGPHAETPNGNTLALYDTKISAESTSKDVVKNVLAKTGDNMLYIILAVAGLALIAFVVLMVARKKSRRDA